MGGGNDGLLPERLYVTDSTHIAVIFHVPHPPLVLDDVQVSNPGNYGFNVISPQGHDITKSISLRNDTVFIECSKSVRKAKLRYAVNGTPGKSGRKSGSRGCLRDSQGDTYKCVIQGKAYRMDNWCFQFEMTVDY